MPNLRVYELAKELKVDAKELAKKLEDMDFDVRNHMSVLSEEEAQKARESLMNSKSEVVEEKRITGRVIRRRRKRVKSEETRAEQPEKALKAEEEQVELKETAKPAPETAPLPETVKVQPAAEKMPQPEKKKVEPAAKIVAKPEPKKAEPAAKVVAKPEAKKAEPAAKIVAKPEAKKAEPPAKEAAKPEAKKAEPSAKEAAKPEAEKAEPSAKEAAKPEAKKAEPSAKEAAKPEAKKAEPPAKEAAKPEAKKAEPPAKEAAKPEAEKAEPPAKEAAKPEAEKAEPPAKEAAKPEAKKDEPPAKEAAKPEAQKTADKPEKAQPQAKAQKTEAKAQSKVAQPKEKAQPSERKGKKTASEPKAKQEKESKKAQAKPRRGKFDTPAKIISLPKKPVAPTAPAGGGRPSAPKRGEGFTPAGRPAGRPTGRPAAKPGRPGTNEIPSDMPPVDRGGEQRQRPKRKKGKKGGASIPDDDYLMRKTASRRKEILDRADLYDSRSRGKKRGGQAPKRTKKTEITTPKAIKRRIKVGDTIIVGELGKRMGIKAADLVGRLMKLGMMVTVNQSLDVEDATLVANELGFEVERTAFQEQGVLEQLADKPEDLKPRPPVVTIMGHVDHGKTSLLDKIREANVTAGEAGGITQHIGAYDVHLKNGGHVVFVDTPGHEAFTEMRARGAKVTDLVVLVVAADDGVMDQTREAINHSRAAKVPIMVAINKIDKPGADPDRVMRELADLNLIAEDWGGDTITVQVSAKTGDGVSDLLEMLDLQAEILELKANPDKPAKGHVLEARLDKGRGPVATVLVQEGTLSTGDAIICGNHHGKLRAMLDDMGQRIDFAGPSIPVEIQGLSGVPEAGDDFQVLKDEKTAKQVSDYRTMKKREAELSAQTRLSLESFLTKMKEQDVKELNLVVKADVHGSMEALVDALGKLGNEEVKVNVIHAATGAITETDVMLAAASEAIIIGFNVRPTGKVTTTADNENVEIRTYDVIYQIVEDVTAALTGMLAPTLVEEILGRVEVRDTFSVPKIGTVAGCYVTEGKVQRNAGVRLIRDGVVVTKTKISSLRRFKDDAKEVAQGFECGIGLERYNDIKIGDTMEVFEIKEVAGKL